MEFVENPYMLASTINDIATMTRIRLQEKPVEFKLDIDEKLPSMLLGDEGRIKQILINLLSNAVKFTKRGTIILRVRSEKVDDKTCHLYVDVEDTGIGIKKEDLEKIFSDFTQVDTKRNRSEEGTGLGLAISQRLVDIMGGSLRVKSVYGEGSVFSFDVTSRVIDWEPIGKLQEHAVEVSEDAYRPRIIAKNAKVLIVDDNEMNLEVTAGILEPYGL